MGNFVFGGLLKKLNKPSIVPFPTDLISKAKEELIYDNPYLLKDFKNSKVYVTTLLDGVSATYGFKDRKMKEFLVCSKDDTFLKKTDNIYWKIAEQYGLKNKIINYYKEFGQLLIIQGEICGENIRHNVYHLQNIRFYVHTIKNALTNKQLKYDEMIDICMRLSLPTVPFIEHDVTLKDIFPTIKTCRDFTQKQIFKVLYDSVLDFWDVNYRYENEKDDVLWKDYSFHEGVVVRTVDYDKDNKIGCSFKILNDEYMKRGTSFVSAIEWV